ncbi:MAG: hypothetical protein ACRDI0_00505 [Actinomycetota bacterium]
MNLFGNSRATQVAGRTLAVSLMLAALAAAAAGGAQEASDGESGAPRDPRICDELRSRLGSEGSAAVTEFGLADAVPVPDGISVGNFYCWGRDGDDGSSDVLAIAVEDVDAGGVWVVFGPDVHELSDAEWLALLGDHGWGKAKKTSYGFTTQPGAKDDLWSEVSAQLDSE